uniref:RRM domain-containing protein n=1 Tax=Oryza brachyantha TaxID=4533 RepID=J3NCU0_ORYBR
MPASNKLGGLFRHSALASSVSAGSSPAMFNAARLMSTKLFVGGLSWGTKGTPSGRNYSSFYNTGYRTRNYYFPTHGFYSIVHTKGRESRKTRGFRFVNFVNGDEAKSAMEAMDSKRKCFSALLFIKQKRWFCWGYQLTRSVIFEERNIHVNFANERPPGNRGGGSYGGGGYGNQGGYGDCNQCY